MSHCNFQHMCSVLSEPYFSEYKIIYCKLYNMSFHQHNSIIINVLLQHVLTHPQLCIVYSYLNK